MTIGFSCKKSKTCKVSGKKSRCVARSTSLRNPFLNFLRKYRENCESKNFSAIESAVKAAKIWNRMPLNQKYPYIEKANKASYKYKSRNECFNRLLCQLREAIPDEQTINANALAEAYEELREWQLCIIRKQMHCEEEVEKKCKKSYEKELCLKYDDEITAEECC